MLELKLKISRKLLSFASYTQDFLMDKLAYSLKLMSYLKLLLSIVVPNFILLQFVKISSNLCSQDLTTNSDLRFTNYGTSLFSFLYVDIHFHFFRQDNLIVKQLSLVRHLSSSSQAVINL